MPIPHDTAATPTRDPVVELQDRVNQWQGAPCGDCGGRLCGHQVLFSIALGVGDRPRCLACLARSLAREADELRDSLLQHFRHRDCYHQVWNTATVHEQGEPTELPSCLWPQETASKASEQIVVPVVPVPAAETPRVTAHSDTHKVIEWDAGEMACGDLVLQLRNRLLRLSPGSVFCLTARDRGAVEDIPAWCRLTGHRLLHAEHPRYRIERRSE